ncbi:MAG: phosphate signaling complex protein PhoU [Actinobacteria bacterium]|nr:phosphate signaling complex protein PhoU [Actinomycetota bacterium]
MRKTFHEKLDEVTENLIEMGSLVQDTVRDAINCLTNADIELAQKVIDGDSKIDDYDIMIEEKCMYIQAEHQPVARDLRLIHSIYIIVIYVERIGDISVSIARLAKRLHKDNKVLMNKHVLSILIEMGNIVMQILDKALKTFKNRDAKLAQKLDHIDDGIDQLQKTLYKELYSTASEDENYIKFVTNVSLASRYLERIGDNSVNIGDRVVYYLTGDFRAIHSDL